VLIGVLSHRRPVLARLRSDAPHHPGHRRRNGALCQPPDVAHVLRLQRTIGNRATTRLLQRDAHALKDAGITTTSRIDDKTRGLIQQAIEESEVLRPYLKGKFPRAAATEGKFEIHSDEDDFNQAYIRYQHISDAPQTPTGRAEKYGGIGGFFDRKNNAIHVRSRSRFGHALHEEMHKLGNPAFRGYWGDVINEGVAQYFTDCVLREQGLDEVKDTEYGEQVACAKKLVTATSRDILAREYFLGDGALREALKQRWKLDDEGFARARTGGGVCQRL
jgi:hypothetical protein